MIKDSCLTQANFSISHGNGWITVRRNKKTEQPMEEIPYKCHVLVCVNDRQGERKSCADGNSQEIRKRLKESITDYRKGMAQK
jgi:hypothetical protein